MIEVLLSGCVRKGGMEEQGAVIQKGRYPPRALDGKFRSSERGNNSPGRQSQAAWE